MINSRGSNNCYENNEEIEEADEEGGNDVIINMNNNNNEEVDYFEEADDELDHNDLMYINNNNNNENQLLKNDFNSISSNSNEGIQFQDSSHQPFNMILNHNSNSNDSLEEGEGGIKRKKWEIKKSTQPFVVPSMKENPLFLNSNNNNIASTTPAITTAYKIPNTNNNNNNYNSNAGANKDYSEYLAKLQQKNRERKRQEEELNFKKKELEQREKGFNLCFSGANNANSRTKTGSGEGNQQFLTRIKISRKTKQQPSTSGGYANRKQYSNSSNENNPAPQRSVWKRSEINIKNNNYIAENNNFEINNNTFERNDSQQQEIESITPTFVEDSGVKFNNEYDSDQQEDDEEVKLFRKRKSTRVTLNKDDIEVLRRSLSTGDPTLNLKLNSDNNVSKTQEIATMETLIEKLKKLDHKKQEYLLKLLDKLEKTDKGCEIDVFDEAEEEEVVDKNNSKIQQFEYEQYIFRIISTWGHGIVGLTEIELFSFNNTRIEMNASLINVTGGIGGKANIMRLFNGKKKTVNENDMWQTTFPTLNYLEIIFSIPNTLPLVACKIWNFNKNINETVKGVRELEILKNNQTVWKGFVQRGCGNNTSDYSTDIQIMSLDEMNDNMKYFVPPRPIQKPPKIEEQTTTASSLQPIQNKQFIEGISPIKPKIAASLLQQPKQNVQEQPKPIVVDQSENMYSEDFEEETEYQTSGDESEVSAYTLELEDEELKAKLEESDEKSNSFQQIVPPLNVLKQNNTPEESTPKNKKEPVWLSKFSSTEEHKIPKGNILLDSLKQTDPQKVPLWFRELENTSTERPSSRRKENLDFNEEEKKGEIKREEKTKKIDNKVSPSPTTTTGRISSRGSPSPLRKNTTPTTTTTPENDSSRTKQLSNRSRPKRPQINNPYKLTEKSNFPNESFDSLMRFKFSHMGRLKARDEENQTSKEPTEIKPPVWRIDRKKDLEEFPIVNEVKTSVSSNSETNNINIEGIQTTKETHDEDDEFFIPINPSGSKLTFNIRESWGDPHYLGLSGIELFDKNGNLITLNDIFSQVKADPSDINALPEYNNDPRTVDKLFDGVNLTCDDMHVWLTPYTPGGNHFIYVDLIDKYTFSMIRLWNYNKSRIHSYRGARFVEIYLDDKLIFKGEVRKAPGNLVNAENFAECILFTTEPGVLEKIEKYDQEVYGTTSVGIEEENINTRERPKTASKDTAESEEKIPSTPFDFNPEVHFSQLNPYERPKTSAVKPQQQYDQQQNNLKLSTKIKGQKVRIVLETSWGDLFYIGLTGIEILGKDFKPIKILPDQLTAKPKDMNEVYGHSGDYRTLDKLIDGINVTIDDRHMWLVPVTLYMERPFIELDLKQEKEIGGIRFYNYNKNLDDTFRGVKKVSIFIDGKPIHDDREDSIFIIRKAPGNTSFDFGHTILFSEQLSNDLNNNPFESVKSKEEDSSRVGAVQSVNLRNSSLLNEGIQQAILRAKSLGVSTPRLQDYQTALLPSAYTFKFHLLSTHGDPHYIGLNGIELYDAKHQKISLTIENIQAVPYSVSILERNKDDVRTPDKLIDGCNNTWNDRHMWLAPFEPGRENNYLYIVFEEPIAISMLKLWNYSKTPTRGVEEIEIYADDVLIYKGFLREAPQQPINNNSSNDLKNDFCQTILFTNDAEVFKKEKKHIYSRSIEEQDVKFYNEKQLLRVSPSSINTATSKTPLNSPSSYPSSRPTTSVVHK